MSHRIGLPGNSLLPERVGGQQLRPVLLAVTCGTGTNAALTPLDAAAAVPAPDSSKPVAIRFQATEASITDCAQGPEWISADVTSRRANVMNSMTPNIY